MPEQFSLNTTKNRISVGGDLRLKDVRRVLAAAHNIVNTLGFSDIELDFSGCTFAYAGLMLAIAATAERYLAKGVDVDLALPTNEMLSRRFLNTNWAHLIDPRRYEPSSYRGVAQIPAARYNTGDEQSTALNKMISKVLSTLDGFYRSHLTAIEWSINEITDNVLNHAMSPVGGFIQANFLSRRPTFEFFVCDAGIGIPQSLRGGHPEIHSDHEALDRAIREGVTRNIHVARVTAYTEAGEYRNLVGDLSRFTLDMRLWSLIMISYTLDLKASRLWER
jgi:hypothetical protein